MKVVQVQLAVIIHIIITMEHMEEIFTILPLILIILIHLLPHISIYFSIRVVLMEVSLVGGVEGVLEVETQTTLKHTPPQI